MNHDYIEQLDLVNRYLTGKLVAEEREHFEEHFIDCPQCIDRLKIAREFKQGLRLVMAEQPPHRENYLSKVFHWFFLERTWTIAACCLLLATTAASILLYSQLRRVRAERDQTKSVSSELQRRYEEQQQTALKTDREYEERERGLTEQLQQLRAENQKLEERAEAGNYSRGWDQLQPNIPIVFLKSTTRDSSDVTEITLPSSPTDFVITISLEGELKYKNYQVTILKDERPILKSDDFKPDRNKVLKGKLNSNFFRPGDYSAIVRGISGKQATDVMGTYRFRIIKH